MKQLFKQIERIAEAEFPPFDSVLILGETGVGKDLIARALHQSSPRREAPFIPKLMTNIPKDLISAELFGHKRGSFADAHRDRDGAFKAANGGTIFLDEIGDMPLEMQPVLLRVMSESEIQPVGADRPEAVNVRIIAATNRDLKQSLQEGTFRGDLFRRFAHVLTVPPLRDRKEDIPLLSEHFLQQIAEQLGVDARYRLKPDAIRLLQEYQWPWNVAELKNLMIRAVTFSDGTEIDAFLLRQIYPELLQPSPVQSGEGPQNWDELQQLECQLILNALKRHRWKVAKAARYIGIDRAKFYRLMAKHHITK
jgi:DNA-binding NtrC family response regulator